ncbi:integral membrane protein GPR155-like [Sinocyclocheilus grahami]|uniref:integral membrane protein GPR155-like n=1 Tax=Sinocyclocheilus grahami TaxID=75366 RepID=UPI0007ACC2EB|nr:PREDICTED: integral membrane protein GPR155-like [Sinocyclocheilus grahami]
MGDLSVNSSIFSSRDGSDPPSVPPSMSIDKLLPALLECFGIILCGYVAGRTSIIPATQAKGLGSFVSKFALPALLFKNMVLLDFGNVIWPFFFSILVAKVTVFFFVCVLTLLVANRESRFSKAGLFSIFATQSNDFALGFPIVEALYRNTHPEYLQYIYLVAPVSLMVLNPLGFAFCEVQRRRTGEPQQQSKLQVLGLVLLQVVKNPIVFMVVIGIISHFLLGQKIPPFMEEFVDGLANSFGGAALFYLGLTIVGQLKKLTRSTVVALILLITAKLLVMPLICRGMLEVLDCGNRSSMNHTSLSNYAFLYGVFPTAPSVAIYASHYNMELEVVTSGMVIGTFLSAPIMYVSAWLLTIPWMDSDPLASALQHVSFNISIISLFALVWSVAVMLLSRKFCRIPHIFTINLFMAQVVADCMKGKDCERGCLISVCVLSDCQTCECACGRLQSEPDITSAKEEASIQTGQCSQQCTSTSCLLVEEEQKVADRQNTDIQSTRHMLVCLLLTVSLLANLSSCLWWLFNKDPGRLYLELQFFCVVVNYGQGLISFAFFGLDKHLIISPFKKRLASLWQGWGQEVTGSAVSEEIRLTCTQFLTYHKEQCVRDIVHKKRCGERSTSETFLGSDMVCWLQSVGLASDPGEALEYGSRLLEGGVIQHITLEHSFLDEALHYRFT